MKIILIGIQGSGKSTQGNLLSQKLKTPYLSTGHIFRDLAKQDTPEGKSIKEITEAGNLIPDDKTLDILDGFPRTRQQAEKFSEKIDCVFYFKVSDKEALWRLSGRDDDRLDNTLKAIRRRIDLFHELTEPVLDYYREQGNLFEIDAEKSIEAINREVLSKINN